MKKKYLIKVYILLILLCLFLCSCKKKEKDIPWKLIWSDEFDGDTLDLSKWSYQIGNGYNGWGNNEKEYYSKKNITVENGMLIITAKKEQVDNCDYTSGRIRTMSHSGECLFSTRYGKIEARISMPEGKGLWPAFWMLPVNNDYGNWPLSGEIDIVEARGRINNVINGTIHFGELIPNNKYLNENYTFMKDENISDFHIYAIEWDTNEIKWTVDGKEYFKTSNWYTKNEMGNMSEYPAPFNNEFYILLNLAVGGTYDDGCIPDENELPAQMKVDYVRVYENEDGCSDVSTKKINLEKDTKAFKKLEKTDNYIGDINFSTVNTTPIKDSIEYKDNTWYFVAKDYFGGDGVAKIIVVNDKKYFACKITNPGDKRYSVQLQYKMPLVKGYTYSIEFDGKADGKRNISFQPIGIENGDVVSYNPTVEYTLTDDLVHYYCSFIMKEQTNLDGIIEFNLGLEDENVYIGNVVVKCIN